MGVAAYGFKVAETATEVRYEIREDPDGEPHGVLVIDKAHPTDAWRVEGEHASTGLASRVAAKVRRRHLSTGLWPERAAHQA